MDQINTMTPEQKLKWAILAKAAEFGDTAPPPYPCHNVDGLYDELVDSGNHWDAMSLVREGQVATELYCESSRHYESMAVAMEMPDGSWVGWTYWFGGGKHGEPYAIEWMESAYSVDCKQEEKLVVVRTFARI